MIFKRLRSGVAVDDREFDAIYTQQLKEISKIHFTPVAVAKAAAEYLAPTAGTLVLDVGSGAGKFCFVEASCTEGIFIGVEQRESLCQVAQLLSEDHSLVNTGFIHSNVLEIEFRQFDAIYFFNSFYEHISRSSPIDSTVKFERALYTEYAGYMRHQLENMPIGTRLATYFSYSDEVPESYTVRSTAFDDKLKFWEKTV